MVSSPVWENKPGNEFVQVFTTFCINHYIKEFQHNVL